MWFHWLQDQAVNQKQFRIYWRPWAQQRGDYWMKHYRPAHHRNMRSEILSPYKVVMDLHAKMQNARRWLHVNYVTSWYTVFHGNRECHILRYQNGHKSSTARVYQSLLISYSRVLIFRFSFASFCNQMNCRTAHNISNDLYMQYTRLPLSSNNSVWSVTAPIIIIIINSITPAKWGPWLLRIYGLESQGLQTGQLLWQIWDLDSDNT